MARHDLATRPTVRPLWKRGLGLMIVGVALAGGSLLTKRRPFGDGDRTPGGTVREARRAAARKVYMGTGRGLPSTPPSAKSLRRGHETEDMSARDMAFVLLGLAAFVAVFSGASIGMAALFHSWNHSHIPLTREQTARIAPPGPHLQGDPHADLHDARAREVQLLHAYAWIDPDHTAARIPIARAMALTVGKSLDAGP